MIHQVTEAEFYSHLLPQKTASYRPVSNSMINELVFEEAQSQGYKITGKGYRSNPSRTEFIAMFTLNKPEQGLSRMIGYRNSFNKKWAVGFVAGALVMICSNGMMAGDIITFRRHTKSIEHDLKEIIHQAFNEISPRFDGLLTDTLFLKEKLIQQNQAMQLLSDLYFNRKLLSVTQMSLLKEKLYVDPNFSLPEDPSTYFPVWNLYNQITEAMKHGNPGFYFQQHIALHDYFQSSLRSV
jgi:hypothetical protein